MEDDRITNSIRNMIYGTVRYIILFLGPFIIRTFIIYNLGIEYVGVATLFSSILQVLSLSELGFSTAIIYSLYKPVANNDIQVICKLMGFYRKVYRYVGMTILVVGMIVCPFVKYLIKGDYPTEINIYIVFLLLLINTAFSYFFYGYKSALFIAYQRNDITSKTQLVSNVTMYIIQIFILLICKSYYGYLGCLIFGTVFNNVLMQFYAKKLFPEIECKPGISKDEQKKLLKSVVELFGHQLDVVIITSADNIVVSSFLGLGILTIYGNYNVIISGLIGLLMMVSNSFLASIGNSIAVESKEKNYRNFLDFTYMIITITGICTVMMFVLFQDFMTLWMGRERVLNVSVVFLMCLNFYARMAKRPGNTYKEARGLWSFDVFKPYVAGAINLALNIFLVTRIGLYGVVISTIFSLAVVEAPWEMAVLFKHYFGNGQGKYIKIHLESIMKMLVVGGVVYFLSRYFLVQTFAMFSIKAILLFFACITMYFIFSLKDEGFLYIIKVCKRQMDLRRKNGN